MSNEHHQRFMREQHEKSLLRAEIEANAEAAELIAERISAKISEQNEIIYRIGQQNGRTTMLAYFSLVIGGIAALAQLLEVLKIW